ncbi:plexin-B2-like isoform X1 [Phyllopteryx taeniolatus]|uniref:plexin-B2-like isoform X1 n=1 Tax=Phyllopteryx taeniolatus TaxID=161469 RepID=UPI002AD28F03|nr:plexin-B2-like isoform X1 [Phyllopteryx taeniolatus]XP_061617270.1 plexin-B2-like isoform X1 [Phyllopteryx taeniolatus]XP_061617271.1 plexin-B2-like isoform X1 [Phyllopteryx taeniolatus]XP_061617272.1 plexin-B2-like isoform X1 [Phyllopteryx taeniolatus]XP_061617273.1 plexin-B2-like isoform X1 [Phyllopteryx taeniolatus]XP_061617274.1 plexin-B2-like isoform X1 [Phyllopteryx taeniolatus]
MERCWPWLFLVTVGTTFLCASWAKNPEFPSNTLINNVVQDPRTGRLYVGAVNALYQLSSDLATEARVETGPRRDNRQCTPPVTDTCEDASETDNHNKLLLVHGAKDRLVVCGSIFRGICSLRNLSNVEHVIYFSDNKGEKSYVVSTEESVSVVGVMSYFTKERDNFTVFLVAKGYGSHDSTKLISTRILRDYGEWNIFENIIDASAVQANPFVLRYLHDFRFAFKDGPFVYFLFSRTLGLQDTKNFTFISRMCEDDQSYYSYTELQLNCSATNNFNKVQAAYVTTPGEVLAQNLTRSGQYGPVLASDKVLFVTFTSDEDPTTSAMCMYPLRAINTRLLEIIVACYSDAGLIDDKPAVYSPYSTKSGGLCSSTNQHNMVLKYKCGAEFLPSPLASKADVALVAEPSLVRQGVMTAVAVAVEMGHAVAFLGTAGGEVLKLHLSPHPEVYGRASGAVTGDKVNKDLLLDAQLQHLYITSEKKITKVPVQSCHLKKDCPSCMALKDPYCGWCVLEGRCARKQECSRWTEENTWLWSPNQQCVEIQAFEPPDLSCHKTQQVDISIPALPRLRQSDRLHCLFDDSPSRAVATGSPAVVTCSLPDPAEIPATPEQRDYVSVAVKVVVNDRIVVTSGEYHFYNCAATVRKNPNTPCISCVTSEWGCQWNAREHRCSDADAAVDGSHVIKPQQPEHCPQFGSPQPLLIPAGFEVPISFQGRNLDIYSGRRFVMGTELMKRAEEEVTQERGSDFKFRGYKFSYDEQQEVNVSFHVIERDTERKIDSTLTVVLYNCSVGRDDCSLCKHADAKYECVWCATPQACVYRRLCPAPAPASCPRPQITDIVPRFGPLNGNISVTIKGSNMGVKKEDIKRISVAGVKCRHLPHKYSVSTSVVCEIGPAKRPPSDLTVESSDGVVEVEVEGGRTGRSQVVFTYRDPKLKTVQPGKGPAAGGTVITIDGQALDTATKDDVTVSVGGVPCQVLSFGERITCKTGKYTGQKVPSDVLPVKVNYGQDTSKELAAAFQYAENPKISGYAPKSSFVCGGRRIAVTGNGFDLIQRASLKVVPAVDDFSQDSTSVEFVQESVSKNDSVVEFLSPAVVWSDSRSLRTVLLLDNMTQELKTFTYHPDPTFNELSKTVITETSVISVIIVTGRGFAKAMTAVEARAFVGDASCNVTILQDDKLILDAPSSRPRAGSQRQRRDAANDPLKLVVKFGHGEWAVGSVYYVWKDDIPLAVIIPAVIVPMLLFIAASVYCYRRKSRQAEREYEKVKHQLENLEESVRDRCKKEFTDLMIEMEDHTSEPSEARIPFLDYKTYTERNLFLPSEDGAGAAPVATGRLRIPESRRAIVAQALNQFSNLLNSKPFLINFIHTLESRPDFNARARGDFASLLTVALHGNLVYYTDITRTLLLELMDEHVHNKNPKLMLRRSETVVERMLCNWMSVCLYQFLRDSAGEPLYKLFKALKHQVEKGPVDAKVKKAKYTLNDTGLLGDDVEYSVLTLQVLVHGEGPDVTPVKVLNCDTISQVKEKIIDQVYRNLPYSQRPKVESVALEWRPGSTGQILSDLDLTSQKEGRWKRLNTLAHYNVRDNATLVLSKVLHAQAFHQHQDSCEERNALLEDDNTFHLVRAADELDEVKSKRGSVKDKSMTKAITEIYLTRLLSVKGTLQQFVDDFFRSVLCSSVAVPPAVKYFFDFLDEQALRHDNVDEETLHIWKTNSLPLRFWVNILRNPHFILDVHVSEVVDASLHVIAQTFMDACTKTEHKLSRESPSNKLLYAKEISTYKKMVDDYYKGIRQMVPVSDQDMNTYLAEVSRQHTDELNTQLALHQLYQYASKYYNVIIRSLDEDPAAQNRQLTLRLQQIAAALENKVTDL